MTTKHGQDAINAHAKSQARFKLLRNIAIAVAVVVVVYLVATQ